MKKNYEMDMCSGPILGKLLTFTIPLIFSGILQLLFNAADVIVVGASRAASLWRRWVPPRLLLT